MTRLYRSARLSGSVEAPQRIGAPIGSAVTFAAQADKVVGLVGFVRRGMFGEAFPMMDVQMCSALHSAFRTPTLLEQDNSQSQRSPLMASIIHAAAAPVLRHSAMVFSSVCQVARDRTEARRVPAVLCAAFHFVGFQAERLMALLTREHDRRDPFVVGATGTVSGLEGRAIGQIDTPRFTDFQRDLILTEAPLRTVICSGKSAGLNKDRLAASLARFFNAGVRSAYPSESGVGADDALAGMTASDAFGMFSLRDRAWSHVDSNAAGGTIYNGHNDTIAHKGNKCQ